MTPQIQKPAPEFKGTAVIDGQFKEIKLSDFAGKYLVSSNFSLLEGKILHLFLYFDQLNSFLLRFFSFIHWICKYSTD